MSDETEALRVGTIAKRFRAEPRRLEVAIELAEAAPSMSAEAIIAWVRQHIDAGAQHDDLNLTARDGRPDSLGLLNGSPNGHAREPDGDTLDRIQPDHRALGWPRRRRRLR